MMARRRPQAAGFYSRASRAWIERALYNFEPPSLQTPPVAGVVPHAGWEFSGTVAARVFATIKKYSQPQTFIFFGTVHYGIPENALYPRGSWMTPFGEVLIDERLGRRLLETAPGLVEPNEDAHDAEHSIEVQMPFLKYFFPEARALPISVLPDQRAPELGRKVAQLLTGEPAAIIIGTTDLTHYGDPYFFTVAGYGADAHEWMKQNDARMIGLAASLDDEAIIPEAERNRNACGAGALAATVAAAKALHCKSGTVVAYRTSHDVSPDREFRMGVGYVGMVFCGP